MSMTTMMSSQLLLPSLVADRQNDAGQAPDVSRFEPASTRDALALVSAFVLGDTATAVHLVREHAAEPRHAASMFAALAYLGSRFVSDIARTGEDATDAERTVPPTDYLEPGVRTVLDNYVASIAAEPGTLS